MYKLFGKRLVDIAIGLLALPFVLIFICVLGPIIYCSDKGTIFYKAKSAENGGYPPTQNGDIRSLFWLFSLMALQN